MLALVRSEGAPALLQLVDRRMDVITASCGSESKDLGDGGRPLSECEDHRAHLSRFWQEQLADLAALVESSEASSRPSTPCLREQGIDVPASVLDLVQSERELAIEEAIVAGKASLGTSIRLLAEDLTRLTESALPVLQESERSLSTGISLTTRHGLRQVISGMEEKAAELRSDVSRVDFEGWFLLAGDARGLAADSSDGPKPLRETLEGLADRIEESLATDRKRFEAHLAEVETDAVERVRAALAACGEFGSPPEPSAEELIAWLEAHPDALADLLEG